MISLMTRRNWILFGLQMTLAVTITGALTFANGCKQAREKREDLGPEFTGATVGDVLAKAGEGATLDGIRVGQFVNFTHTRRLENSETVMDLGSKRVEVISQSDPNDSSDYISNTLKITETMRQENGKFTVKESEETLDLRKRTLTSNSVNSLLMQVQAQEMRMLVDNPKRRVTFHQLRESYATIDVPPRVAQTADCGGLSPCEINAHYVQFSMVIWEDEKNYQKINFDFAFSTQTPLLPYGQDFEQLTGVIISDCRSTYLPLQSRTIYVRDCYDLDDFKK